MNNKRSNHKAKKAKNSKLFDPEEFKAHFKKYNVDELISQIVGYNYKLTKRIFGIIMLLIYIIVVIGLFLTYNIYWLISLIVLVAIFLIVMFSWNNNIENNILSNPKKSKNYNLYK